MLIDIIGKTGGWTAEAHSLPYKFPGDERACMPSMTAANSAAVNA